MRENYARSTLTGMRKPTIVALVVVAVTALLASVLAVATRAEPESPVDALPTPAAAVAHRGFNDINPENTMIAFQDAIKRGADAIEMDVMGLKDGTLVLSHDTTIDKTSATGATGIVKDMTADQWRQHTVKHPAGGAPAPAAFLDDVLDEYGHTDTVLVPELKQNTSRSKFIDALLPYKNQIVVQSFDADNVSVLTRSGFRTLQLTSTADVEIVDDVFGVGVRNTAITTDLVERAHNAGAQVWAWGVDLMPNDPNMTALGIDGIIATTPAN